VLLIFRRSDTRARGVDNARRALAELWGLWDASLGGFGDGKSWRRRSTLRPQFVAAPAVRCR
jgi:hypothetical protein